MSLASEDDPVRLTLEVAPGGDAVRVVLISKRFERLLAARARAMERASRPPRAAASSVFFSAPSVASTRSTASTASKDARSASSRRPDLSRGRDAPARWWMSPDVSETDRGGDEPAAAAREGRDLGGFRGGRRRTNQRSDDGAPNETDDANANATANGKPTDAPDDGSRAERAAARPSPKLRTFSRPAAAAVAPPRARLKARSAAAALEARAEGKGDRVGGVPSSLALARCAACGAKRGGVAVSLTARYASRRDGLWRSRDACATVGVLGEGARARATNTPVDASSTTRRRNTRNARRHSDDDTRKRRAEKDPPGKDLKPSSFTPCARCGDAWYCDETCIVADWPRHRRYCAGVRCSFAPRDGSACGDLDLGYARGERFGSAERESAFLETSVARGTLH